ncbi:MAG: hypothetical protein ACRD10_15535, partial [Terriglobia bacterium]
AASLFLISWAGLIFVFFSISHSKLPGYFLPALIPLSILMAGVWRQAETAPGARLPDWLTAGLASMIFIGLLIAVATRFLSFHELHIRLAAKLPPSVIAALGPSMLLSGLIVAALGFLGRSFATQQRRPQVRAFTFVIVAATLPLLVFRWIKPAENYFAAFSSRALAQTILASPERNLPVYGFYYFRTGLPFYLHRAVGLVTNDGDEMTSNYVVSRFKVLRSVTRGSLGRVSAVAPLVPANVQGMNELSRIAPTTVPARLIRGAGVAGGASAGTGEAPLPATLKPTHEARQIGGSSSRSGWLAKPLFIDGNQLQGFAEAAPGPFLLIVRNTQVNQVLAVAGSMRPLWQAWQYSIWEKNPEQPPQNF